ncbi:unnamed protein product [Pleuronectes platessa]|uniref:Uncharacterized protein n=1 Tax=Pleuronectes platessa TaxID=8262 RepID=A0A9N7TKA7_PLEPL|nr:unnamed protein product [Pleuronectes platessa]
MDNSDEPEDLLDGKIVFQKNKDRTFSKTKQYPPNHRNAKHVLLGEGRSSGMRQTSLTRRTHCAKEAIAHRSRGSAPRPAHSLRDTRPELLHVKELSAAPINDFGPQRPPECSEQHGYNAKFQQYPDI